MSTAKKFGLGVVLVVMVSIALHVVIHVGLFALSVVAVAVVAEQIRSVRGKSRRLARSEVG